MGQADEETCLKQAGISDKAEQEKTPVSHDLGVPESREVKEPKTIADRGGWWTGVLLKIISLLLCWFGNTAYATEDERLIEQILKNIGEIDKSRKI